MIDPCSDGPGYDEVLLRLADGQIVAWYYGQGLAVLTPGSYVTTDPQACQFTVAADGEVSWAP